MVLKDQGSIPDCLQMVCNAERGHDGSILGQGRRELQREVISYP